MWRPGGMRGAEEVLEEIRSELLECKVCFEPFVFDGGAQGPRVLPCGHLICLSCVRALSHPASRNLECPFCRAPCQEGGTHGCQALLDLHGLVGSRPPRPLEGRKGPGGMRLCRAFGGWDRVANPTGVAVSGSEVVVVHGGSERGAVFGHGGEPRRTFGREICHPMDVAVAPGGHVVVTDAGDGSVKVFSAAGRLEATVSGPFELPWGVAVDPSGGVLVTDASSGRVWRLTLDLGRGAALDKRVVARGLHRPRAVGCCGSSGRVVVVEHLGGAPVSGGPATRLSLFDRDMVLLRQLDTFGLDLTTAVRLSAASVAFDKEGDLMVADPDRGTVWSLGDPMVGRVPVPLIKEGLLRPVGLAVTEENGLVVLDGEDHALKVYGARS